jgi:hypothetical protein
VGEGEGEFTNITPVEKIMRVFSADRRQNPGWQCFVEDVNVTISSEF